MKDNLEFDSNFNSLPKPDYKIVLHIYPGYMVVNYISQSKM